MGLKSLCGRILVGFLLSLFLVVSFCYADENGETIQVVGFGECADCKEHNIKTSQAFSELHVTIDCKLENGEMQTRGMGEVGEDGKFEVSLPKKIVKEDGGLKEECFAQLHSASASPCPAHNSIEASKIVAKPKADGKVEFQPAGNVKFSAALCTSAFFFPFHKKPLFKKPFPFYKPKPKVYKPIPKPPVYIPPVPIYKPKPKPPVYLPPVPVYKPKPKPPVYIPKVPIYKPKPKPPVYIPPVPIYKPKPKPPVYIPPVPIYKPKPKPPIYIHPVPIYKPIPKPPIYFPPVPIYKPIPKPPIYFKPPFKPLPPHLP